MDPDRLVDLLEFMGREQVRGVCYIGRGCVGVHGQGAGLRVLTCILAVCLDDVFQILAGWGMKALKANTVPHAQFDY